MTVNIVSRADDLVRIKTILVSVSNKTGLDRFIPRLVDMIPDLRIFSTGGTHAAIGKILGSKAAGRLAQVSDYTGQPETQGGLVKTLDFKIYLGLLTETYNDHHQGDLARTGAVPIDMVVVNLYPFRETISLPDVKPEQARANIDIGGPCMIRAAAKNYLRVAPVVDPGDYDMIMEKLAASGGGLDMSTRFQLAARAFKHTSEYDTVIASYLADVSTSGLLGCYALENRT
jgi:phosphoribosylaminoimidazolecarboxamide formyltransferase/IMP cyclohydrolase